MSFIRDQHWVRQAFLVTSDDLEATDIQNRTFTTASVKYTDTTPGGNIAINPPAQFTRYADIRAPGRFSGNMGIQDGSKGMGRYYSEAIDDNAQVIHLRFGVPQFAPMSTFFTGFYNTGAGQMARTGRATSSFYMVGRAAGFIVSIMSWKLLAVHLIGLGARFLMQKPSSKFYYMKPAMPLYWNAVTTMVNHLAVNRGIIPRVGAPDQINLNGNPAGTQEGIAQLHALLPDVFKKNGGIDVYALANRAKRLERKHMAAKERATANAPPEGYTVEQISKIMQGVESQVLQDSVPALVGDNESNYGDSYMGKWLASNPSKPAGSDGTDTSSITEAVLDTQTAGESFFNFLKAELDDGGAFASFRVNSTGPVTESFSNTVGESDISSKINGMSASARNTKFNFGGGNLVGGVAGAAIGGVVNAAKDFVAGIGDSLEISGLAALAGAAFVDIPKHWQSSAANLPHASYTIELRSPYGNAISQLLNLDIPLAMLLAGVLPLSTGKQSYTSPFLVELFDKGRCQTRLGMIDSMTITRGQGNLGFNNEGHAMGIDVTFSIVDMSSILHMPITEGFSLGTAAIAGTAAVVGGVAGGPVGAAALGGAALAAGSGVFDEDTSFSDYMAILAGMGVADQIYQFRKLMLNITRAQAGWDSYTDPSRFASFAADTLPGRLVSAFYKGTPR
jgi:hypothetical protein